MLVVVPLISRPLDVGGVRARRPVRIASRESIRVRSFPRVCCVQHCKCLFCTFYIYTVDGFVTRYSKELSTFSDHPEGYSGCT